MLSQIGPSLKIRTNESVHFKKALHNRFPSENDNYWEFDVFLINAYLSEETFKTLVSILKKRADFQVAIEENVYYHFSEVTKVLFSRGVSSDQIVKLRKIDQKSTHQIRSKLKLFFFPSFLFQIILLLISPVVFFKLALFSVVTKFCRTNSRTLDLFRFLYHIFNQVMIHFIWNQLLRNIFFGVVLRKVLFGHFLRRAVYGQLLHRFIYGQLIRRYLYGRLYRGYLFWFYYKLIRKNIIDLYWYRLLMTARIKYYSHHFLIFLCKPFLKIYWFISYQFLKLRKNIYE